MSQEQHINSRTTKNYDKVKEQVKEGTGESVIALIASQLDLADEARERITKEGSVVRDLKGCVIAHPAISIEQSAMKLVTGLLCKSKYGKDEMGLGEF